MYAGPRARGGREILSGEVNGETALEGLRGLHFSMQVWLGPPPSWSLRPKWGDRMYAFELPRNLMARLAAIRERTGKPLAKQVREAVAEYCERVEADVGAQVDKDT